MAMVEMLDASMYDPQLHRNTTYTFQHYPPPHLSDIDTSILLPASMFEAPLQPEPPPPTPDDIAAVIDYQRRMLFRFMQMYEGTQLDEFMSDTVQEFLHGEGRMRRINVSALIVNTVLDRIRINRWSSESAWVTEQSKRLGMFRIAAHAHKMTEVFGVSYMLVWPDPLLPGHVNVIQLTPLDSAMFYSPRSQWPEWAGRMHTHDLVLDIYGRHTFTRYVREKIEDGWQQYGPAWPLPDPWRSAGLTPPIVPIAEDQQHPISGLADVVGPQTMVDLLTPTDAALVEFSGFPIRYALYDPNSAAMMDNYVPETRNRDTAPVPGYYEPAPTYHDDARHSGPGALWNIAANEVGQFAAATPATTLERILFYVSAALAEAQVPQSVWTGISGTVSGETLRREQQPLINKCNRRITSYTDGWERVWSLSGLLQGKGEEIQPEWDDPAQPDEKYRWNLAITKEDAGLPIEIALVEAGVDPATAKRAQAEFDEMQRRHDPVDSTDSTVRPGDDRRRMPRTRPVDNT